MAEARVLYNGGGSCTVWRSGRLDSVWRRLVFCLAEARVLYSSEGGLILYAGGSFLYGGGSW